MSSAVPNQNKKVNNTVANQNTKANNTVAANCPSPAAANTAPAANAQPGFFSSIKSFFGIGGRRAASRKMRVRRRSATRKMSRRHRRR
jgi:hypothetical protein